MSRAHDEQTLALAALFQTATLVDQIATRGLIPQQSFESSLSTLFVTNPQTTEDVFGGVSKVKQNLSMGLKSLTDIVDRKKSVKKNQVTNYVLSMIMLEQKLAQQDELLNTIGKRISGIQEKALYFSPDVTDPHQSPACFAHPNVVASIADLYQETLGTFKFRIQVSGDARHLQNTENAAKIRALLLAGIRAAMLWRQVGGKRMHLFFFRSRLRPSLRKLNAD